MIRIMLPQLLRKVSLRSLSLRKWAKTMVLWRNWKAARKTPSVYVKRYVWKVWFGTGESYPSPKKRERENV